MITKVEVKDHNKLPVSYAGELDAFQDGRVYEFKPGVNIIIGKNGSGKSTLINLIADYTLCHESIISKLPNLTGFGAAMQIAFMFDDTEFKDGLSVTCDYAGVVYRLLSVQESNSAPTLSDARTFFQNISIKGLSSGESTSHLIGNLFQFSFTNKDVQFPLCDIARLIKDKVANPLWTERLKNMAHYYMENRIELTRDTFEYTYLMDEPDRNLDITVINDLYKILSFHKPMSQIIAAIHNPVLIYKLSKVEEVNFIEMTDGYLEQVKEVFENI